MQSCQAVTKMAPLTTLMKHLCYLFVTCELYNGLSKCVSVAI
jgi:hypothetical protein